MAEIENIICQPSTSKATIDSDIGQEDLPFMTSYIKQDIRDGLKVCCEMLESLKIAEGSPNEVVTSIKAKLLGEKMAEAIIEVLKDFNFYDDHALFLPEEEILEGLEEEEEEPRIDSSPEKTVSSTSSTSFTSQSESEKEYEPQCKERKIASYMPLETKIKIVNMVREHPKWSIQTIHKRGGSALQRKSDLKRWCAEIEQGGGIKEKYEAINKWTIDRFREAREQKKPVTTRMLQQWASQAAVQFEGLNFVASHTWAVKFKQTFQIRQRKVTRYIKSKNVLDISNILKEAEKFQKRIARQILKFDRDYVINTDQTGCEYRVDVRRILSTKGEKSTEVFLGDFNKITHSYTAQYAITASGKLLPKVFLCMQEPKGVFGPRVSAAIDKLSECYDNIHVTASKSGKLTKDHFSQFVVNIIKPYCNDNEFLLILDSWGGQTDPAHFNSVFTDDDGNCSATVEIIPPHCTPYCQPCDLYFFRQVKNFIRRIQNSVEVLQQNRQLSSREDAIKIHSLIHSQLSAGAFTDMIEYAWFASKLIPKRNVFRNVNEICFPPDLRKNKCICNTPSFIHCANCRKFICFKCFYDVYHPNNCSASK